jgi:hypothetical protein
MGGVRLPMSAWSSNHAQLGQNAQTALEDCKELQADIGSEHRFQNETAAMPLFHTGRAHSVGEALNGSDERWNRMKLRTQMMG